MARSLGAFGGQSGHNKSSFNFYEVVDSSLYLEVSGPPDTARDRIVAELSRRLTLTGEAFGISNG